MAEKSEKATPKKLRDARKKGQVAKSQDFPAAFTFIVSISTILAMSTRLYNYLTSYMISQFKSIPSHTDLTNKAGGLMHEVMTLIFSTSMPIMLVVSVVGVLVNFLIIGPVFSMEAMKPDLKKLNPVTNIKNMFKIKTFIELLKSIFKISGALILIYSVIASSLDEIISTCMMPFVGSAVVFSVFLKKVVLRVGIFFIMIGVFDLVFQKRNFAKEMKMEKFEVKQEHKDTEGDPQIKSKRRQIAQEIAYQEGPKATRRATAVVTNPSHIAVALEYAADDEPAPRIATMGLDRVAVEIIRIAQENDIPIMRNVELAQTLYYKGNISDFIPEETYETVAEVLKWVGKLEEEAQEEELLEIFKR